MSYCPVQTAVMTRLEYRQLDSIVLTKESSIERERESVEVIIIIPLVQSDVAHEIYRPTPRRAEAPRSHLSPSRGPLALSPLVTDTAGYISLSSGRKSSSPPSRATPVVTRGHQMTPGPVSPSPSPANSVETSSTKLEINTREVSAEI